MKRIFATVALSFLALVCVAAPNPPRLAGIVNTPKLQAALLEIPQERGSSKWSILRVGVADRHAECEVVSIDPPLGAVTLLWGKEAKRQRLELRLPRGEEQPSASAVLLHNADVRQALHLYQIFSGRTIIRSPSMVIASVNLRTPPTLADADCAAAIEKVVNEQGLIFRQRGTAFTFVVAENEIERVDAIPNPPAAGEPAQDEVFPPGLMNLEDAHILQSLEVHSELIGRTILQPHRLPLNSVSVRSQSALSRTQAIWLMEAVMALGDLVIVPLNEKFVFAVPTSRARDLPKFDERALAGKAKQGRDPELIKLTEGDTVALLEHYAAAVGRKPVRDGIPKSHVWLNCKKPFAGADLVFALEATAALNNLAFEFVEPDGVTLRPIGALQKKKTEGKR